MPFQTRDAFVLEQELSFDRNYQRKQSFISVSVRLFSPVEFLWLIFEFGSWFADVNQKKRPGGPCEPPAVKVIPFSRRSRGSPLPPRPCVSASRLSRLRG